MKKTILNWFFCSAIALSSAFVPAFAQEENSPDWQVEVDRATLGMDESVALRFTIKAEGSLQVGDPQFEAPDFDEVNQYSSVFVESYYENGRFGVRNNKKVTRVLRPAKTGKLRISGIKVQVNGKWLQHPAISLEVTAGGQGTPPPPKYGGSGAGLRGMGKTLPTVPFTVRVELDRGRAYKGQQVIVSYYLYRRSKVFNVQVQKYPILDGFLREDLDLPILGQRLQSESVVVDGVPYERSLLARYAAYPLKEGKLPIDSMAIKGNYYPGSDAEVDLANPIQSFFQQVQPREWTHRSDRVDLEVVPLPGEGRPTSFTGGVGEFTLDSAVDRVQVRANDALTVTFKVEGTGNVAAITEPKVQWPSDVEVFETKSRVLSSRGGVSTKVFEVLIIPRRPGNIDLPAAELSYFSVKDRGYRTLRTAGHAIQVLDGGSSAQSSAAVAAPQAVSSASPQAWAPVYVLPEEWSKSWTSRFEQGGGSGKVAWVLLLSMLALSGALLVGFVGRGVAAKWRRLRVLQSARRQKRITRNSEDLRRFAQGPIATAPWEQVVHAYQQLSHRLLERIEETSRLPARALSRDELFRQAVEGQGLDESLWKRVCQVLEYCEWVSFGARAGMVTEPEARSRFDGWLTEVDEVISTLSRPGRV